MWNSVKHWPPSPIYRTLGEGCRNYNQTDDDFFPFHLAQIECVYPTKFVNKRILNIWCFWIKIKWKQMINCYFFYHPLCCLPNWIPKEQSPPVVFSLGEFQITKDKVTDNKKNNVWLKYKVLLKHHELGGFISHHLPRVIIFLKTLSKSNLIFNKTIDTCFLATRFHLLIFIKSTFAKYITLILFNHYTFDYFQ